MSAPVARHAFWIDAPRDPVAATLHVPASGLARANGVLVLPPFGHEYTHAHRSLVHLADDLAEAGFVALRIDYPGTGDSAGDADTPDLFEAWVATAAEAIRLLTDLGGGAKPTVVGLRFGVLLAALATARTGAANLVAWHPVSSGKRFLREHQALQRMADSAPPSERPSSPERLEAAGFLLARTTVEALERVDVRDVDVRIDGSALILDRDDLGPDGRLAERLEARGTPVEVVAVPGYLGMMAEPQYTVIPQEAIDTIVRWIDRHAPAERVVDPRGDRIARVLADRDAAMDSGGTRIRERHVTLPAADGGLVGVLSSPATGSSKEETVVLLANSGSVHHVGPNRLYVEVGRALAREGIACLRFDLRNLGDSRLGSPQDENHPYPATAVEDVRAAIAGLRSLGYARFVVAGLCSGAHTAFHAGLELDAGDVGGVICLNPLTFQWQDGMSLDTPDSHRTTRDAQYYSGAVRSWSKWKKLLTGRADLGYIVRFAGKRVRDVVNVRLRNAAQSLRLLPPGVLGERLERYPRSGRQLRFVFSTRDPGYPILLSEAGPMVRRLVDQGAIRIDFVEGADHTFSREAWRVEASAAVVAAAKAIVEPREPSA